MVIDILRGSHRCACKRVKRRDIFYIYGYLPLLCSRAGGLWQRANRRPSFPPCRSPLLLRSMSLLPSLSLSLSVSLPAFYISPTHLGHCSILLPPAEDSSAGSAGRATGGRTMCHLPCHPIFRSYHDMLKARSTLTLDILYGFVCAFVPHLYIDTGCRVRGTASTIRAPEEEVSLSLLSLLEQPRARSRRRFVA